MKKLLLLSIIALQGASMWAMTANNEELSGEAAKCYNRIKEECSVITSDVLAEMLVNHPELPTWKTKKGNPLLFCFINADNAQAVEFLIENGADTVSEHNGRTPEKLAKKKEKMRALLEEARDGKNKAEDNQPSEDVDMSLPQEYEDMLNDDKSQGGMLRYATPKNGLIAVGLTLLGTYAYKRYTGKAEAK